MEFGLLAVKASRIHVPETLLLIVLCWFVPIVGSGPIYAFLCILSGELLLDRHKSESSPQKVPLRSVLLLYLIV